MDSTVADSYLRSTCNPHWLLGRPIVYWIIDVWSTAIVGVHVCFLPPSWDAAKVALFSSVYRGDGIENVYGFTIRIDLDPYPTLCALLRCDRGEYLSAAALRAAANLGFAIEYNPSYRPDLKGLVEVFNRIQKDEAYGLIPGAFDKRREDIANRPNAKISVYTPVHFLRYLTSFANMKNLTRDCAHICPAELIADGLPPTPAGMWKWGHTAGIGYRTEKKEETIIQNLLPTTPLTITASGLMQGDLQYVSSEMDISKWSALARLSGRDSVDAYRMPAAPMSLWAALPNEKLRRFELAPNSKIPPGASLAEYSDVKYVEAVRLRKLEHEATAQRIAHHERARRAAEAAAAELAAHAKPSVGLTIREARAVENAIGAGAGISVTPAPDLEKSAEEADLRSARFRELIEQVATA